MTKIGMCQKQQTSLNNICVNDNLILFNSTSSRSNGAGHTFAAGHHEVEPLLSASLVCWRKSPALTASLIYLMHLKYVSNAT